MATLTLKSFTTLVSDTTAAIQARSSSLLDFSIGSVLRALTEANSGIVLWLESMILQVLATTRAATSTGVDLDSFVNDYGVTRLPGVVSTGQVTFARFTATTRVVVPVGVTLQTSDGTQKFVVVADAGNGNYSAPDNGYVLPISTASIPVTCNSINQSSAANVQAGTITVLTTATPGIDTVNNPSLFTAGQDPETDTALRARFRAYLASLAKATRAAIAYAISTVQSGLYYSIVENVTYPGGASAPGTFYIIVDDGTGAPSSTLLTNVFVAVDAVRAAGIAFQVYPPTLVYAGVVMAITTDPAYDHPTLVTVVNTALNTYINGLGVGVSLPFSRLMQIAYDASPGVTNVSSVTINGVTADLTALSSQVIRSSTITVS